MSSESKCHCAVVCCLNWARLYASVHEEQSWCWRKFYQGAVGSPVAPGCQAPCDKDVVSIKRLSIAHFCDVQLFTFVLLQAPSGVPPAKQMFQNCLFATNTASVRTPLNGRFGNTHTRVLVGVVSQSVYALSSRASAIALRYRALRVRRQGPAHPPVMAKPQAIRDSLSLIPK